MITPYNILRHELIGLEARVVDATHPGYKCRGKIVNETRNTIDIETKSGRKRLPKDCIVLELKLPLDSIVRIDGKLLVGRPENRIKKKYRIKFV
ncbi:MAG: ribonuclease P protein subunit [Candidatus Altiarchaeales archaeon]|nr:MAG: ribonuclease P protein subunit [Candidatus Altiarchaeales archaeon]HDO82580.1 ribonuclease P protein component 1 [Candidatus Altiarchaeales archaeon]HEX55229.1 ribonuclease P protein component 1 [Candidatus Altiarchaeales archaeon]